MGPWVRAVYIVPEAWVTALRCLWLDEVAEAAAQKIRERESAITDVRCEVLGRPTPALGGDLLGGLVAPTLDGDRAMHFRCARVADNEWLVHKGTYKDTGELDEEDPFNEKDLVVKNIVAEAWAMKERRRLRTSEAVNTMRSLVQANDFAWCRLLAIAAFRAEEIRASTDTLDVAVAVRGFERNPFRWDVSEGWRSQASVTFLWTWTSGLDGVRRAFVPMALHNLFIRDQVSCPPGMCRRDAEMYRQLLAAADIEARESKVPCVYLGLEVGPGRFEQDPACMAWPAHADVGPTTWPGDRAQPGHQMLRSPVR